MAQTPAYRRHSGAGSVDYTPGGAVTAGDVVVLSNRLVAVATHDIAASALGALATDGVFAFPKVSGRSFAQGQPAYWDADATPVSGDASSGAMTDNPALGVFAGFATAAAAKTGETVDVRLEYEQLASDNEESSSSSSSSQS